MLASVGHDVFDDPEPASQFHAAPPSSATQLQVVHVFDVEQSLYWQPTQAACPPSSGTAGHRAALSRPGHAALPVTIAEPTPEPLSFSPTALQATTTPNAIVRPARHTGATVARGCRSDQAVS